jgi:lauroyl/myristoyl acyltransferase
MQIGPARIAKMGKLPLIPMTITYNPQDRVHDLRIGRPINADDPLQATDNALNQLIAEGDKVRWQYYHDLGAFRKPWTGRLE